MIAILCIYVLALCVVCIGGIVLVRSFVRILQGEPPFVPTSRALCRALTAILSPKPGGAFYDLGSGDGRVVCAIAKACPESLCVGVEQSFVPYLLSRLRLFLRPIDNARMVRGDFYTLPLAGATHVYMYLFPKAVEKLFPRLAAELQPGAVVVCCDFPYAGRKPDKEIPVGKGFFKHILFVYTL